MAGQVVHTDTSTPSPQVIVQVLQLPDLGVAIPADYGPYVVLESLFNGKLFHQGRVLIDASAEGCNRIAGACLNASGKVGYIASSVGNGRVSSETLYLYDSETGDRTPLLNMEFYGAASSPTDTSYYNISPWFFNASGTEATAVRRVITDDYVSDVFGTYYIGEYHKFRLTVDLDAGTAELADLGLAVTETYEKTVTQGGSTGIDFEDTGWYSEGSQAITRTIVAEFADYLGDAEVTGQIEQIYTRGTAGRQEFGENMPVYGDNEEVRYDSDAQSTTLKITLNGSVVFNETVFSRSVDRRSERSNELEMDQFYENPDYNPETDPGYLEILSETHVTVGSGTDSLVALSFADLRNGAYVLSVRSRQEAGFFQKWAGNNAGTYVGIIDSGGGWSDGWEWTFSVPGSTLDESAAGTLTGDSTATGPLTPIVSEGQYDWDYGDAESYVTGADKFPSIGNVMPGGNLGTLYGMTAFYPGEPTRVIYRAPLTLGAATDAQWRAAEMPVAGFITGGNLEALLAVPVEQVSAVGVV